MGETQLKNLCAHGRSASTTLGGTRPPVHAWSALLPCLLTLRAVPCPRPSAATVCPPAVFCSLRSPCFLPAAGSSSSVRARARPPAACSIPSRSWPRRCQGAAQAFACSLAPLRSRGTRRVPCLPLAFSHMTTCPRCILALRAVSDATAQQVTRASAPCVHIARFSTCPATSRARVSSGSSCHGGSMHTRAQNGRRG